jgi:hypothetical protein
VIDLDGHDFVTPLDKHLKRVLLIKGVEYVITLTPEILKVTRKGHRIGVELSWESLISGDSALAVALQASLGQLDTSPPSVNRPSNQKVAPSGAQVKVRKTRSSRK